MPDADLSATLSGIREDIEATVAVYDLDGPGKNSYPVSAAISGHARVLLAVIDAVLKLADDWEEGSFRLDVGTAVMDGCARELREAITRELSGTRQTQPGEEAGNER